MTKQVKQKQVKQKQAKPTPKYQFCWSCGNKLRANFYREFFNKDDGQTYIVHAECLRKLNSEN